MDALLPVSQNARREILSEMQRGPLQKLAKELGVKANGKTTEIIDRILDALPDEADVSQGRDGQGAQDDSARKRQCTARHHSEHRQEIGLTNATSSVNFKEGELEQPAERQQDTPPPRESPQQLGASGAAANAVMDGALQSGGKEEQPVATSQKQHVLELEDKTAKLSEESPKPTAVELTPPTLTRTTPAVTGHLTTGNALHDKAPSPEQKLDHMLDGDDSTEPVTSVAPMETAQTDTTAGLISVANPEPAGLRQTPSEDSIPSRSPPIQSGGHDTSAKDKVREPEDPGSSLGASGDEEPSTIDLDAATNEADLCQRSNSHDERRLRGEDGEVPPKEGQGGSEELSKLEALLFEGRSATPGEGPAALGALEEPPGEFTTSTNVVADPQGMPICCPGSEQEDGRINPLFEGPVTATEDMDQPTEATPVKHQRPEDESIKAREQQAFERGRKSGIWLGMNQAKLENLQGHWSDIKENRGWSLPSLADVQEEGRMLVESGFTTVTTPLLNQKSKQFLADQQRKSLQPKNGPRSAIKPQASKKLHSPASWMSPRKAVRVPRKDNSVHPGASSQLSKTSMGMTPGKTSCISRTGSQKEEQKEHTPGVRSKYLANAQMDRAKKAEANFAARRAAALAKIRKM